MFARGPGNDSGPRRFSRYRMRATQPQPRPLPMMTASASPRLGPLPLGGPDFYSEARICAQRPKGRRPPRQILRSLPKARSQSGRGITWPSVPNARNGCLCLWSRGGFLRRPEFSSRARTCSGTALAYSLVCSQSLLIGSSASRISLDGAAVSAGALWRVGARYRSGPWHQATPQEGVGAGEALALLYRQAESP
jgi:hypothetical protein